MTTSKGHDLAAHAGTTPRRPDPSAWTARPIGKMKKGKLRPERKIDLHGMTLTHGPFRRWPASSYRPQAQMAAASSSW